MLTEYKRYLPHILPSGETVFVTFRVHGSLPLECVERLIEERKALDERIRLHYNENESGLKLALRDNGKRYFAKFDASLDEHISTCDWLKRPAIAEVVATGIRYHDGRDYQLHAYCIMPNHVHLLVTILEEQRPFYLVLKSLKGITARRANQIMGRTGAPFWQPESYDHVVRDGREFERIVSYILNNPIKAGLVSNWEEWPHSYVADV